MSTRGTLGALLDDLSALPPPRPKNDRASVLPGAMSFSPTPADRDAVARPWGNLLSSLSAPKPRPLAVAPSVRGRGREAKGEVPADRAWTATLALLAGTSPKKAGHAPINATDGGESRWKKDGGAARSPAPTIRELFASPGLD